MEILREGGKTGGERGLVGGRGENRKQTSTDAQDRQQTQENVLQTHEVVGGHSMSTTIKEAKHLKSVRVDIMGLREVSRSSAHTHPHFLLHPAPQFLQLPFL